MTNTTLKSKIRHSLNIMYDTGGTLTTQVLIAASQAPLGADQAEIKFSLIILSRRTSRLRQDKQREYDEQHKVIIFYWSYALQVIVKCNNLVNMPKVIDKYVLQEKIGNGQFGQVYKGIHQQTLQVVAIKTIRRDMIKGKFYELLENEIKVLKTCDNPHIIKLNALKKTPHNYYLMLEYCNGGDMLAKIKEQGPLKQQEVIRYFCQILNAFQTLVNHKIMHRDFKLANILLHDGNIKIADFGFAKLMANEDYTSTMLGSPLNMAPEVLGNSKYNTKADIWSIGACIYEMIYGKPPYVASNMVDLLKLIKSKPLVLPSQPVICPQLADVLKKMLVADVKRRAEWSTLFNHPVTTYLSRRRRNQAELQLAEDQSLMLNTSKCYLKNNLILTNANEIKENSTVNEYLVDIIRTGKKLPVKQNKQEHKEHLQQSENYSKVSRHNSKKILHYRNIYAFLASVADTVINRTIDEYHEIAAYVIVRKILETIQWLLNSTSGPECGIPGIQNWNSYCKEDEFLQIKDYLQKERDVFSVFNHSLEPIIKRKALQGQYDADVKQLLGGQLKEATYRKYLKLFLKNLAKKAALQALHKSSLAEMKQQWKLLYYGLKIVQTDATFGTSDRQFDFKQFYVEFESVEEQAMLLQVQRLLIDSQN